MFLGAAFDRFQVGFGGGRRRPPRHCWLLPPTIGWSPLPSSSLNERW